MAHIRKELTVAAPPAKVWEAFRDVGAVHTKLARGFVTDCRMDGEARVVSFANGLVIRELIVDLDDAARRLAYSARSGNLAHHSASFQVSEAGDGQSRIVWLADLLPESVAPAIAGMMEAGCAAMKRTLEAG